MTIREFIEKLREYPQDNDLAYWYESESTYLTLDSITEELNEDKSIILNFSS